MRHWPGGHEVVVVEHLNEGLDLGPFGDLLLAHGCGHLTGIAVDAGDQSVAVGAVSGAIINVLQADISRRMWHHWHETLTRRKAELPLQYVFEGKEMYQCFPTYQFSFNVLPTQVKPVRAVLVSYPAFYFIFLSTWGNDTIWYCYQSHYTFLIPKEIM